MTTPIAKKPAATRKSSGATCPMCGASTETDYQPFCSKRCADIDLGRWLDGRYVIPEANAGDDDRSPTAGLEDDDSDTHR